MKQIFETVFMKLVFHVWAGLLPLGGMILVSDLSGETIYVDIQKGDDRNPGTEELPYRTIYHAATRVNSASVGGPTTVKVAPGVYNLDRRVLFGNNRPYTREERLVIEATILPDDPEWRPVDMPVFLSSEDPGPLDFVNDRGTSTYGFQIEVSHVTIRGLKFLGSSARHNRYYPIRRNGKSLKDLEVTQCLFVGDRHALPIHLPVIANGHGLLIDHSIFYNCKNSVVYWFPERGLSRGNAMRYCIVAGAYRTGIWLTDTDEDFEFHNNIIADGYYFFMRRKGNTTTYRLRDSVITNNKYYSGYGNAGGPKGETGDEVSFDESNVIREGEIQLVTDEPRPASMSRDLPRNYLHVAPGTLGSNLGAGLFKK